MSRRKKGAAAPIEKRPFVEKPNTPPFIWPDSAVEIFRASSDTARRVVSALD